MLDALERVIGIGQQLCRFHMENAQNEELESGDQEAALNCSIVLGQYVSSMKLLAAGVAQGRVDLPIEIEERHWWSTENGIGKS